MRGPRSAVMRSAVVQVRACPALDLRAASLQLCTCAESRPILRAPSCAKEPIPNHLPLPVAHSWTCNAHRAATRRTHGGSAAIATGRV
jgi:hypothetical protein